MMSTSRRQDLATSFSVPPKSRVPGYGGFCPTVRTNCGLTYGLSTKMYYDNNRKDTLNTSVKPHKYNSEALERQTPVVKSLVVAQPRPLSASAVTNNPWEKPLPYSLHLESNRRGNVLDFEKTAQVHRSYYKDHTGLAQTVPAKINQRWTSAPAIRIKHQNVDSSNVKLPPVNNRPSPPLLARSTSITDQCYSRVKSASGDKYTIPSRSGSARERAVRNAFFEKR